MPAASAARSEHDLKLQVTGGGSYAATGVTYAATGVTLQISPRM